MKIIIFTHQSYSYDLLCPDHSQAAGLQSLVNVRVDQENIFPSHHRQEGTTETLNYDLVNSID